MIRHNRSTYNCRVVQHHSQYSENDDLKQAEWYSNKQANIQSNEYCTEEHHHPHQLEGKQKHSVTTIICAQFDRDKHCRAKKKIRASKYCLWKGKNVAWYFEGLNT